MENHLKNSIVRENNNDFMRFVISIVLSCISISLLTLLISVIPIVKEVFWSNEQQALDYTNFFYKWSYSNWTDEYTLEFFRPSKGYYIFSPIIMVFLFISNSCILVQNYKRIKTLIFINLGLSILPVIAFIIIITIIGVNNEIAMPFFVIPILVTLGFYQLIYLPIQIMLLVEKKSITKFFAIKSSDQFSIGSNICTRRINGIIASLIFLYASGSFFHSVYSEFNMELFSLRNKYAVAILISFWFFTNIAIFRYKRFKRIRRNFFALSMGITSIIYVFLLISMSKGYVGEEMMSWGLINLTIPDTIIIVLFYTAIILFWSIPAGMFSNNKKDAAIIATFFNVGILIIGIFIIKIAYEDDLLNQGSKMFYVFERIYYILVFYAGALWGKFLGKKLYGEYNKSTTT